jgi:hypothetical protein
MTKAKLQAIACKAFAYAKEKGYKYVVYEGAPLVRSLDFLFQSECKYCMASRAVVFGLGLGFGGWIGLALVGIAVGLTVIERFCKGD